MPEIRIRSGLTKVLRADFPAGVYPVFSISVCPTVRNSRGADAKRCGAAGNYTKGQRKPGGKLGGELQGAASQLLTNRAVCVIIYRGILRKYLSVSILEGNL